jgi:hypothetical protein
MSILNNSLLLGADAAAGGYEISRSVRFNSSDSASCARTFTSAGNRRTWTWAAWIKRSAIAFSAQQHIWGVTGVTDATYGEMFFGTGDTLRFAVGYNTAYGITTTRVFRDPGAWFHLVLAFDATQGTAANKIKLYINGVEETAFSSDSRSSLANQDWGYNNNVAHYIGRNPNSDIRQFNGYLADIHFIDGQALDPSSFGEFDTNNVWQPKAFSGSYGTNGFHLPFSDNSTAAALGTDTSSNGNDWTVNNLSVTAGAGNDSLVDSPTNYGTDTGAGGEVRGNYATLNPLIATSGPISNGNLEMVGANAWRNTKGTISVSTGKWYFEATYSGGQYGSALGNLAAGVGFAKSNTTTPNVDVSDSSLYGSILAFSQTGHVNNFNAPTSARSQIANGDVIGFALNYDAGTYTIYVNNTSTSSGSLNFTGELTPWSQAYYSGAYFILNFGQRPFAYTAPSGFKALCTTNLPEPVVAKPNTVFDTVLWTGNDTGQTITMPGAFSPDLVWTKTRSVDNAHWLFDVIRGADQGLSSSSTTSELTRSSSVTAFGSTGFTLGTSADVNSSAYTYVAWTWDAGSSTVTNTQGSITSQVRANASAGFSIVSYTGNNTAGASIGHGLNVAPEFVVCKDRDSSSGWWAVYHSSQGNTKGAYLNSSQAFSTQSFWNNTTPTSSVFTVGANANTNANGNDFIAYCFAPVSGYSSFGSYTGNGSADGPFVFCNFRPRWILTKATNSALDWNIFDAARDPYNSVNKILFPNDANAESDYIAYTPFDFLSNGFKLRTNIVWNASSTTYIYAAFAEHPFATARAR